MGLVNKPSILTATRESEQLFILKADGASGGLVAKSCPTLTTPWRVACLAPLFTGISQARILEWVATPFSRGIFPTQELNPGLLYCRWILYQLSYEGSP